MQDQATKWQSIRKRLVRATAFTGLFGALIFAVSLWFFDPPVLESTTYPCGIILRDRNGEILRVGLGPNDQDCRPYYTTDRKDWVVQALIAAEDKRFLRHFGIDPVSLLRAIKQNLTTGRRISGASTITSQAVRLITPHPRTLRWKYSENFQALRLEYILTKDQILAQYLNRAPLGSNLVGIEAGAMGWFGKTTKVLSLGEATLLVGMMQSPTRFRPDRNLTPCLKRRDYVLSRMLNLGMITKEQKEGADSTPLNITRAARPFNEPFFSDWAQANLPSASGDFTTTLDPELQRSLALHVAKRSVELGCSVSGVIIDVKAFSVRALTCSGDYFSAEDGQVNTALSPRPAGSTLKPFILAKAMDMGLVMPSEMLADIPRQFGPFQPVNFDGGFRGLVTASDALLLSLNMPFIDLVSKVGIKDFHATLQGLGLTSISPSAETHGAGIAVGNADVRLLDLANAYAAIARGGVMTLPHALKFDSREGNSSRLFSPEACWMISDMLSGTERSENAVGHIVDARIPRIAWKTGTSSANRDAWTIAWNPEYVVGIWCGHKIGKFGDTAIIGGQAAAPVAWSVFRDIYPTGRSPWFTRPEGIEMRKVCEVSGKPTSSFCEHTKQVFAIQGRSSPSVCTVHRIGPDGTVIEAWPPSVGAFLAIKNSRRTEESSPVIVSPADQSTYRIIPGIFSQAITAHADRVADDETLWWFLDAALIGTTTGKGTLVIEPPFKGHHRLTCATANGRSASVSFAVE